VNFPLVFAALFAWFIWKVRSGVNGMAGSMSAAPDVDCTTYRHPVWKRGVGQRWIPATTETIGVVCGFILVRVDPQTGERIYTSPGSGQTGQDPYFGEDCEDLKWWQFLQKALCSEWLQSEAAEFQEAFEAEMDDY